MTKKIFILLFFVGSMATFAQSKIDGKWKGTREGQNGTIELNYTFKVEGDKLTGTWVTPRGENKIEDGKVDGKKFSYTMSFGDMTIENHGELVSDNEIVIKTQRGEMKLTRVE
ncbi:hypothetical protein [Confluentibacter sediminis]|uniref:hypothetical protein n=1 Tax=Confluentibacter sediminis TaxID=2219045 RepID=UPI000DAD44A4|nr:hypothetical protein [Confluentibacter sediminis]